MSGVLLDILIILVAAKVAAEVAERLGVPSVVGEILAGVVVGPSVMGLVSSGEVLRTLAELGVILLLLQVGLEMDLAEMGAVGRSSLLVAVVGVVLPFVGGYGVMQVLGEDANTAVFMGAALTATSVGITARVFGDLRALSRVESRTVLGAAVADDVLGLVILTVVVRLVAEGGISVATVGGVAGLAVGFLVVTAWLGTRLGPLAVGIVQRLSRSPGTLAGLVLAFALGVAELASAARLATIVGAFVAGLALARSDHAHRIRRDLAPIGHLFVPVFFLQIGIDAELGSVLHGRVLLLSGALLIVAVVGKMAAAAGMLGSPGDKLLVGLGMLPRGEVGLIFAGIGLREKVLSADLYAALILVVLATTLAAPPLLRWRLARVRAAHRAVIAATPAPEGGWLRVRDGVVDLLQATPLPPPHQALTLALQAALDVARCRPGPGLLDWLGSLDQAPLRWDRAATTGLFELLRGGNARSWRFLETTGMLERALPEVAEAVGRRRADPLEVDPAGVLRFQLVDRVHELVDDQHQVAHPEWLVLAALLVDLGASVATARQVVKRLDLGAAAEEEAALLVGQSDLLRAAAARPDGLDEWRVMQIASHLDRPERAAALYILCLALGELDDWHRLRLEALHEMVQALLARPGRAGRQARNLAEQRCRQAVSLLGGDPAGKDQAAADRLTHAPWAWLLAEEPAALAHMAELLEPLPRRGDVRVAVVPLGDHRFRVEVACRDQRGLLASIAGVMAGAGLDVVEATAATWLDGGAADALVVRSDTPPDSEELRSQLLAAWKAPFSSPPIPDAVVDFDHTASPWYTLCSVEAGDRPGLLHALATAFASSGADVHSARVTTKAGKAHDRFELTDGRGEKLNAASEAAIVHAIGQGVEPRRTKLPRNRNNWLTGAKPAPPTVPSTAIRR